MTPPQIATVEATALAALKQAFHAFPARVLSFAENTQQYTHMAEVSGGWFSISPGFINCGLTADGKNASTVWYPCNLGFAQWALGLQDTDLSAATGSPNFTSVLKATGEGIGNTAAHEIAHQFLSNTCGMNDQGSDLGAYDAGSADAGSDPSMYTGVGPNGQPLHWSHNTAICLVNRILYGSGGQ